MRGKSTLRNRNTPITGISQHKENDYPDDTTTLPLQSKLWNVPRVFSIPDTIGGGIPDDISQGQNPAGPFIDRQTG